MPSAAKSGGVKTLPPSSAPKKKAAPTAAPVTVAEARDATPASQALSIPISTVLTLLWVVYANEGVRASRDFSRMDTHLVGTFIVAVLSTIANVGVVSYHWMTPPHPKFVMLPARLWCIRAHVWSGTTAIIVSAWAVVGVLFYPAAVAPILKTLSLVQAVSGAIHCASAAYQTPIVFGARAIMLPGYTVFIATHAAMVLRNFYSPGDIETMLDQYMVLCTFTWVRIYLSLLYRYRLAPGNEYTLGVVLAGMTTMPCIVGPTGVLQCLFYVFCLELTRSFNSCELHDPKFLQLLHEIDRNRIINTTSRSEADSAIKEDEQKAARAYFDQLDLDHNGTLDVDEIKAILEDSRVNTVVLQEVVRASSTGKLTFEQFYRRVWSLRDNSLTVKSRTKDCKLDKDQCRLVFETLDGDGSGFLETHELSRLLVEWGCPNDEVLAYLRLFDDNGDGKVSFDEFYTSFRPVWRFCFYTIDVVQKEEDLQRTIAKTMAAGKKQH